MEQTPDQPMKTELEANIDIMYGDNTSQAQKAGKAIIQ